MTTMERYSVYVSGSLASENADERFILNNWKLWADNELVVEIKRAEKIDNDNWPFPPSR